MTSIAIELPDQPLAGAADAGARAAAAPLGRDAALAMRVATSGSCGRSVSGMALC